MRGPTLVNWLLTALLIASVLIISFAFWVAPSHSVPFDPTCDSCCSECYLREETHQEWHSETSFEWQETTTTTTVREWKTEKLGNWRNYRPRRARRNCMAGSQFDSIYMLVAMGKGPDGYALSDNKIDITGPGGKRITRCGDGQRTGGGGSFRVATRGYWAETNTTIVGGYWKLIQDGWWNEIIITEWICDPKPKPGPAPVPEPATMLLLGTGLIGLAAVKRKGFKR